MFYLNTIEQLFLFVEQLDQLEVCLPYSKVALNKFIRKKKLPSYWFQNVKAENSSQASFFKNVLLWLKNDGTLEKYFLTPPSFFLWKIDPFWLLFDPKYSFWMVNWILQKSYKKFTFGCTLGKTVFGVKE